MFLLSCPEISFSIYIANASFFLNFADRGTITPFLASAMAGIYIHIPFCRRKCIYCDFYSTGTLLLGNDWARKYAYAAAKELQLRLEELKGKQIRTLYIGGGTPSLLPPERLSNIIEGVDTSSVKEFTIEVNPDDVDEQRAGQWAASGINRVSMGVQSFVDAELKAVGRRHSANQAEEAFMLLNKYFANVSIDLIFGLPGQTTESWNLTLNKALSLHPQHISAYTLMYEPGTALTRLTNAGKLTPTSDESIVDMYGMLAEAMKRNGYEHYEISNFALPGFESRHNLSYWTGEAYIGIGPGAHSFDGNSIRRANAPDLKAYLTHFNSECSDSSFYEEENLSTDELREEMILTRLRMKSGLSLREYADRFGNAAHEQLLQSARREMDAGRLFMHNGALRLTDNGLLTSDSVILALADF